MLVQPSTRAGVYQLTPTKYAIESDCQTYLGFDRAYTKDCYLRGLINKHPMPTRATARSARFLYLGLHRK